MRTFGEFYDEVHTEAGVEAQMMMEEWRGPEDSIQWEEARKMDISNPLFLNFLKGMVGNIQELLGHTSTEALYARRKRESKEFIEILAKKAQEFGLAPDLPWADLSPSLVDFIQAVKSGGSA